MPVETASRTPLKRDHDSFEERTELQEPSSAPPYFLPQEPKIVKREPEERGSSATKNEAEINRFSSPAPSATGSDNGSATTRIMASSTFAALNGSAPPPPKKTKLTMQERELKRITKENKDSEKAEEKARRDSEKARKEHEKAVQAAEKAKKDAEKEAHRKLKEGEKAEKERERQRKEAEREQKRAAQEAEKAAKEEKRMKAEEEKKKKEKGQKRLADFFAVPNGRTSKSPAPRSSDPTLASPAKSPSKPEGAYEKLFPAFFLQKGVSLAPVNRFERDGGATEYTERKIDGYISGTQTLVKPYSFNAASLFNTSTDDLVPRGRKIMAVKEIMEEFYSGRASRPIDLTTDSQMSQVKRTGELLRKIPLKFLKFQEDVRPPYRGTYTSRPMTGIAKLARNPLRRDLPNTDYDYDSEAEWIEDEDGEELKSGDEDEEVDDDEDMDGFLDDENDEIPHAKRAVVQGELEPVSTGLCWEDKKKRNSNVKMLRYRMEVIIDPNLKSIDPFSVSYWPSTKSNMEPPRVPLNNMKATSLNFNSSSSSGCPSSKPVKPFFTTASDLSLPSPSQPSPLGMSVFPTNPKPEKTKKLLAADDMDAFKLAIVGSDLSKVGLIEVLKKKFPGRPAASIKATLETVALRGKKGEKERDKRWYLVEA